MDTSLTITLKDLLIVLSFFGGLAGLWMKLNGKVQRLEDTKADKDSLQQTIALLQQSINDLKVDLTNRLTRIEAKLGIKDANKPET